MSFGQPPFAVNATTEVVSVETAGPNFNNGRHMPTFNRPVRHCQWTATPASIQGQGRAPTFIHVSQGPIASTKIEVFTSKHPLGLLYTMYADPDLRVTRS